MGVPEKDDRRKHSRVGFTTRINVILETGGSSVNLEASSQDLSIKGVFVPTLEQFPLDSSCSVNIFLTGSVDEIKLEIEAKIVRQTEKGIGIEFESMDVDTYTHLKNIVHYNTSDNGN